MTFLQSLFLFGLFAVVLPLLIHLFNLRKKERIPFSSLYFLKLIENKKIRRLKLKQLLLLLLRMAVVALLVLAFARPTLIEGPVSRYSYTTPVSSVIIVDNSMSTALTVEGRSMFESIRRNTLEVLNSFKDGDEIYLLFSTGFTVANDGPVQPVSESKRVYRESGETFLWEDIRPEYSLESVRRRVENAGISRKTGDLFGALQIGVGLLEKSSNLFRELYLVSDMQATNFYPGSTAGVSPQEDHAAVLNISDINSTGPDSPAPVRIFIVSTSEKVSENYGIVNVSYENQIMEQGKEIRIRVAAGYFGSDPVIQTDRLINLYLNDVRVAQKSIKFSGNGPVGSDFRIVPEYNGIVEGMIEIEDDALPDDNRRYFVLRIPQSVSVLLVNGPGERPDFIESVYASDLTSTISVKTISESRISTVDFRNFDVVIYNGFSRFTNADTYRIRNFCSGGGGVIIFPGKGSDLQSFNESLGTAFSLPAAVGYSGDYYDNSALDMSHYSIGRINYSHPLFTTMFKNVNPEPELPAIFRSVDFTLTDPEHTRTVLSMSNNRPFLTETNVESGKVMLFASAPSLEWSTLPVQGIFAPLMYRLVYYCTPSWTGEYERFETGDTISMMYRDNPGGIAIRSPVGETFKVSPAVTSETFVIEFAETDEPGIYSLQDSERTVRKFAVNVSARESDIRPAADGMIGQILGGMPYTTVTADDDIAGNIRNVRSGLEITKYVTAVVLLLLLTETVLQHERSVREPDETQSV